MSDVLNLTQWETRVSNVHNCIISFKMTSLEVRGYLEKHIYTELRRTWGQLKPRRVYSTYENGYVHGLIAAQRARMWTHMEFCYLVDGVLYSTFKESVHRRTEEFYERGEGHILANSPGNHFWLGTNKPYTGSFNEQL